MTDMNPDLLRLIDLVYQSAADPEYWDTALDSMTTHFHGEHALLFATDASRPGPGLLKASAGLDAEGIARFASPMTAPLWHEWAELLPKGKVVSSAEQIADRDLERSEIYNELVRPANGFYAMSVQHNHSAAPFHLITCRRRNVGAFASNEVRLMESMVSHVATAIELQHRVSAAEHRADGLASVIEKMADGAIVLDETQQPLLFNARAVEILDQNDGLLLGRGGLRAATASLTEQLQDAITVVGTSPTSDGRRVYLPRPSTRLPLLLHIAPIWRLHASEPGLRAPRTVIFIREPDAALKIDTSALGDVFRLTPRESEIAALVAGGINVENIAERFDLTTGTVRFNLKRIFDKTGVRTQAALGALVRNFSLGEM